MTRNLRSLVRAKVESDDRLQGFLRGALPVLRGLPALFLVRGAVRDYATGAQPEDYDLIPAVDPSGLAALAERLAFRDRTHFGGFRHRDEDGLQVDLFLPDGCGLVTGQHAVVRAMDSFEFSCDAMAYDLLTGDLFTREENRLLLDEGRFTIQRRFLDGCSDVDLAYVGVKAVWIMAHCGLRIDASQVPILEQALGLVQRGRRRYVGAVLDKIRQLRSADSVLEWTPSAQEAFRRADREFSRDNDR